MKPIRSALHRQDQRLQCSAKPTLKELLLTDEARADLHLPKRGRLRRRQKSEAA